MAGFSLEFKRIYSPTETTRAPQLVLIGSVHDQHVHGFKGTRGSDTTPSLVAAQDQPPRDSANYLEPVNDVSVLFRAKCAFAGVSRSRTVGARSGLWTMLVVLLPSTTSTNQRYQSSSRNETHRMLALAYGPSLLVLPRHKRHLTRAKGKPQQRPRSGLEMLGTSDTDGGTVGRGCGRSEPVWIVVMRRTSDADSLCSKFPLIAHCSLFIDVLFFTISPSL